MTAFSENGGGTFAKSCKSTQKSPSGRALPSDANPAHSVSAACGAIPRILTTANGLPSENLCGFPIPFPFWTPEWRRLNCHLGAVPTAPQRRSGTKTKFVAILMPDTEFWSGPRQNRTRSNHECNRGGVAKTSAFRQCRGLFPTGKALAMVKPLLFDIADTYQCAKPNRTPQRGDNALP